MATRIEREKRRQSTADILSDTLSRERDSLRNQAGRHASAWADPDDALQDACLAFLRAYDGPPGEHAARYLTVAVKHSAWALGSDAASRHAAPTELTTTDAFDPEAPPVRVRCERPGPAERAERCELVRAASAALAELKRDERVALLLLGLGYSYREICEMQNWTYTRANRCLAEGRAALRALAEGGESEPLDP
jgi:RNA polymerase sigma factor (sigma-70 family)